MTAVNSGQAFAPREAGEPEVDSRQLSLGKAAGMTAVAARRAAGQPYGFRVMNSGEIPCSAVPDLIRDLESRERAFGKSVEAPGSDDV